MIIVIFIETVDSLLRGMELSDVKKSVDSLLSKETIDLSKFTKPKKKKNYESFLTVQMCAWSSLM